MSRLASQGRRLKAPTAFTTAAASETESAFGTDFGSFGKRTVLIAAL